MNMFFFLLSRQKISVKNIVRDKVSSEINSSDHFLTLCLVVSCRGEMAAEWECQSYGGQYAHVFLPVVI